MSSARSAQDKTIFQVITPEVSRKKREEQSLSIRKNKRSESLLKRRMNTVPERTVEPSPSLCGPLAAQQTQNNTENISSPNVGLFGVIPAKLTPSRIDDIPLYLKMVSSGDPKEQFEATIRFRKLLSIEKNPPIDVVINSGIVPTMVNFLRVHQYPKLQFEAAWALTNIASGTSEQTQTIVQNGAAEVFVDLLRSPDAELREQAVWALGNIAGDSTTCRDILLNADIITPLLHILNQQNNKLSMQRNAVWCLSNLCRGKPQPNFQKVSKALPVLRQLIHSTDNEVLVDACWAVSYLCDGTEETIDVVLDSGVMTRMAGLLTHPSASVQTPALRAIGNVVTGNDKQTQVILDLQVLPSLLQLLASTRKSIKKEASWVVSNITAGNKNQTGQVISSGVMQQLVSLMQSSDYDIKKEAAWAVSNATSWKVPEQIKDIVRYGAIRPFIDILKVRDFNGVGLALEAIENILIVGERVSQKNGGENPYLILIEDADGVEALEDLDDIDNTQLYEKSEKILNEYWSEDQDTMADTAINFSESGTSFTPAFTTQNSYNF